MVAALGCEPPRRDVAGKLTQREDWDIAQIHDTRLGYAKTIIQPLEADGIKVISISQTMHMALERFGQPTSFDVDYSEHQTPDGQLLSFSSDIRQGPSPLHTEGHVRGGRMEIVVNSQNKQEKSQIAWPADAGGLMAPELSLLRKPMKAGEHRTVRHLDLDNQIATTEMAAIAEESTKLATGVFPLLRIDIVDKMSGGQSLERKLWVDRSGDALKSWTKMLDMESFRVTKEIALAKTELPKLDLLQATTVKVDRPIANAHTTHKVRYIVSLPDSDPSLAFATGPSQEVKKIDDHTAEITVYALRPGVQGNTSTPSDPPTDDDRRANNFIQSDDPLIVANARKIAADLSNSNGDPWQVAVALESFVNKEVNQKDYLQAFPTASDVAKTHEGDCKGHAVYLAALARARSIPARVAMGLVYIQNEQAFGYHMWTEVYIEHHWVPLDATLGRGGIGGGHLKLTQGSLAGASAYSSFLPVMQVIGKLTVKVAEVDP
jgi:hypothetical protein